MPTSTEILAKVAQLITASDKYFAIVNGPASGAGSTVTVGSGVIPTFAKKMAELVTPEVLEPDWITFPDMTGTTIPPYSLGQKGGVLYYGNNPLTDGKRKFVANVSNPTPLTFATFAIPAADMVDGKYYWMELDISLKQSGTVGDFQTILLFDFLTGSANDGTTGFYIDTGRALLQKIRVNGLVRISNQSGAMFPELVHATTGLGFEVIHQAADSVPVAGLTQTLFDTSMAVGSGPGGTNLPNVANSFIAKLLFLDGSTIASCQVVGTITFNPWTA